MKKTLMKLSVFVFAVGLLAPISLMAQKDEKDKEVKEKDKNDVQQIIITRKGNKDEKTTVEINGDKVTVNGKSLDEYNKDKDGDITVRTHKYKTYDDMHTPGAWSWNGDAFNFNDNMNLFNEESDHAMLGVTTEKVEEGVKIEDVTKESGAEKAGLKEGDIITKVDDKKIEDPDDLSKTIRAHKAGDKVTVTYLRDKKEQRATAELTKYKGFKAWSVNPGKDFKMDLGDINPRVYTMPRINGQNWSWSGGAPKLGLSVQDTDDGKGVKVIEVDDESNSAKAGVKEDDIITEVDGKAVNGTDAIAKIIRDSKDKPSVMLKILRGGKTQNIEVKMPHKIKTADL